MARVFVSHAGEDLAPAREVRQWLVETGHEVFLDQDLRDGIALGEQWRHRLHERLRWADAVVCVVTSAYLASTWCTAEVAAAQARGSRLLPLLAEPEVVHPLLADVQHTDMASDRTLARAELAEALRRIDDAGGAGWPDDRSPFPGLRPFDLDRHRVFFGRAEEVKQLTELLRATAQGTALLVVGPSGCGKSSLVRAGLAPVMADEPGWRTLPPILPGADPVGALARDLAAAARRIGLDWTVQQVRDRLADGGLTGPAEELLLADPSGPQRRLLIVVDQFEELLTQTTPAERARFAELLRPALTGPVRVVATLRPEFLDALLLDPALAALPTRTYTLRPLSREALRLVIDGPARLAGIDVDEHLVARLVDDTDTGEALPLLAFTLAQLADGIRRGGRLSTARYEQIGGVQGALTRQADAALAEAISTGGRRREEVIAGLLRLVTVDEQGRPTRWRVNRAELPAQVVTELDAFVARRLLITDTANGTAVIGVAHEAFLSAWPPLAQAIDANTSALRARRAVEQAATEWDDHGRPRERLWSGGQLAAAVADTGAHLCAGSASSARQGRLRWQAGRHRVLVTAQVDVSPAALNFLHTSIRHDRSRRRRAVTVLSALLVLALIATGIAFVKQRDAQDQQRIATARQLVVQAETALESDPQTAFQLGIAARQIHSDAETHSSLINLLTSTPYAGTLIGNGGSMNSVAFSPDGQILATGAGIYDGTVTLWDFTDSARPRRLGQTLTGHDGGVNSVSFSPDGRTLAVASSGDMSSLDGAVTLWDLGNLARPRRIGKPLTGHGGPVMSVSFSPGGEILATGSDDPSHSQSGHAGKVLLWDVTDRSEPRHIGEPVTNTAVSYVAFSPGGHTLAVGGIDMILWDVSDPTRPRRIGELGDGYMGWRSPVAFSPDGRTLAVGGIDVIFWDVSDPTRPRRIGQPLVDNKVGVGSVRSVAFSPGGGMLAIGDDSGTTTLWNVSDLAEPSRIGSPLTGHREFINSVSFSPDGRTLATASDDGTSMLWDMVDRKRPRQASPPLGDHVYAPLAFSSDGRILATASTDNSVILWDFADPNRPRPIGQPLTGHTDFLASVAFSPDGHILATGANDYLAILWDITDPSRPRRIAQSLTNRMVPGKSVAFSPDGGLLATSHDYGVILWDMTDPARPMAVWQPPGGDLGPGSPVAFSRDGRRMATGGDGEVILWDIADPAKPHRLGLPLDDDSSHPASSVAFSADGRALAIGNYDGSVMLWNIADPTQPQRIGQPLVHNKGLSNFVAFSPDGRTLITSADDGTIVMWDLSDPAQPHRLGDPIGFESMVAAVAFTPDGRTLAAGASVNLWDLSGLNDLRDHAMQHACAIAGDGLDRTEWARYIRGLPYQDTCPD